MIDKIAAEPTMKYSSQNGCARRIAGISARTAGALWIGLVVFFYFFSIRGGEIVWRPSHLYYRDSFRALAGWVGTSGWSPLLFILTVIGVEYFLLYLWRRFYAGEKALDVPLSPFLIWIVFSIFFVITALG